MTHFLVETLEELLRDFYLKFIWPDILANVKTTTSLLKIDVSNRANQLLTSKMMLAFHWSRISSNLRVRGRLLMFRLTSSRGQRSMWFLCLDGALISLGRALCRHFLLTVWSVSHPQLWLNSQKSMNIFLTNCWWSLLLTRSLLLQSLI